MRVEVFDQNQDPERHKPRRWTKARTAQDLINRGWAREIRPRIKRVQPAAIQMTALESRTNTPSSQGAVYEAAGADFHPRFVRGGLTRTEHKPVILKPFHGARVGHQ